MKIRKLLALVLALVMVTAAFSGCGNNTASVKETSTAASEDSAAEIASTAEEESAEIVSDEETSGITLPISEEKIVVTLWNTCNPGAMQYIQTYADCAAWAESFERTNIYLESTLVGGDVGQEAFALMAASGDYTDMIGSVAQFYTTGTSGAYNDGIIIDLASYVEEYCPNMIAAMEACNFTKDAYNDDGQLLAFVDLNETKYAETGLVIRKDWLEELGMTEPETYDELYEVLKAMHDKYGASMLLPDEGINGSNELISGFGVSVNRSSGSNPQGAYIIEDGKIISCRTSDGYREYLCLMNKWYAEGLIYPDFMNSEVQQAISARPCAGLTAVLNDEISVFPMEAESIDTLPGQSSNPNFSLAALEEPTKSADDVIVTKPGMRYGQPDLTISTQCSEELIPYIMKYVNYMFSEEGQLLINFGVEGLTFEYDENHNPQFTDLMLNDEAGRDFRTLDAVYLMGSLFMSTTEKVNATTSDAAVEVATKWLKDVEANNVPSLWATMTAEESEEYYEKFNDIATYFKECTMKFIVGDMDPNGDDWDTYVTKMNEMGHEDLTPIIQNMYDRYMAR